MNDLESDQFCIILADKWKVHFSLSVNSVSLSVNLPQYISWLVSYKRSRLNYFDQTFDRLLQLLYLRSLLIELCLFPLALHFQKIVNISQIFNLSGECFNSLKKKHNIFSEV